MPALLILFALASTTTLDLVEDCGVTPNVSADDDSPAVMDCAIAAGQGGVISVPPGTYDLQRQPGASVAHSVLIPELDDLTFICEPGAIFKKKFPAPSQGGDDYMFHVRRSHGIKFDGCTFDGNRAALTSADEQTHIFVTYDATYLTLDNCTLKNSFGDGIKVIGTKVGTVYGSHDLLVDRSTFMNHGRGGIGLASTTKGIVIRRSEFYSISDQAIDFEPGGGYGLKDVLIEDVVIGPPSTPGVYSLTLSGGSTPTTDVIVRRTRIYGAVHAAALEGALLEQVEIISPRNCFTGNSRVRDFSVIDSTLVCGEEGIAISAQTTEASPANFVLYKNRVTLTGVNSINWFFKLDGGGPGNHLFVDNEVWAPGFSNGGFAWVRDTLGDGIPVAGTTFVNNKVQGFKFGIFLAGSYGLVSDVLIDRLDFSYPHPGGYGIYCDGPVSNVRRTNNRIVADNQVVGCP